MPFAIASNSNANQAMKARSHMESRVCQCSDGSIVRYAWWFGEDQARYIVAAAPRDLPKIEALAARAGISLRTLGTTGGGQLTLPGEHPILVSRLQERHESWLPEFMGKPA